MRNASVAAAGPSAVLVLVTQDETGEMHSYVDESVLCAVAVPQEQGEGFAASLEGVICQLGEIFSDRDRAAIRRGLQALAELAESEEVDA